MLSDQAKQLAVAGALEAHAGAAVLNGDVRLGELTFEIDPAHIVDVCRFLKADQKYVRLSTVTAVDWVPMEPRFEVVYHLHSMERRSERLRLKCKVSGDDPEIDSVCPVWVGANWYEREVFDLFGIRFRNHPDLTRLMLPDDWQGHPLRRDYPIHGHKYDYATE